MALLENKQTAIEWAEDKLSDLNSAVVNGEIDSKEYHEIRVNIWKKAKAMEKEQIIDARVSGFASSAEGWNGEVPCMKWSEMLRETKCEEYYNETYNKQ
jgi:hypothetical protein